MITQDSVQLTLDRHNPLVITLLHTTFQLKLHRSSHNLRLGEYLIFFRLDRKLLEHFLHF